MNAPVVQPDAAAHHALTRSRAVRWSIGTGASPSSAIWATSAIFGPMAAVTGPDLENQEQHLAIARAGLSDAAYEAALARGGSMSDEDAIEYVIGELDRVLAEQHGLAG